MRITLPLHETSVSEKLRLMEALRADLSQQDDAPHLPLWHNKVLEHRESRIASDQARFSD